MTAKVQNALDAEFQRDQLALRFVHAEKQRESAMLLVHKLGWIATLEGVAILMLILELVTGGAS